MKVGSTALNVTFVCTRMFVGLRTIITADNLRNIVAFIASSDSLYPMLDFRKILVVSWPYYTTEIILINV